MKIPPLSSPLLLAATACLALAVPACQHDHAPATTTRPPVPSSAAPAAALAPAAAPAPAPTPAPAPAAAAAAADPVQSNDILARQPLTQSAEVQHVLVSWQGLPIYAQRGPQDPRGAARTKAQADALALEIAKKARAGADFAALMKQYSEDPGSAQSGQAYPVTPEAGLVAPFKALSLRLKVGEVGIVQTDFGWHVIKRIQ